MSASGSWRIGEVLRHYVRIALLKRGPDDLPASQPLLLVTVAAYVVASLIVSMALPAQTGDTAPRPAEPWVAVALDAGLMLLWLNLLLRFARRPERFLQTATAVFGFQLVLAPVFAAGMWAYLRYSADEAMKLPASLIIVALGLWALVVNARIIRAATDWPMVACIGLVLAEALLARGALLLVFPEVGQNAAGAAG